jgi:hypothetical protein
LSEPIARSAGRPHGFRPVHLVVGVAVACAWVGLTAFVLTHGKGESSSVDVYSELPPGFTAHLRAHGVQYQGLSPVDAATTRRVLAQPLGGGVASAGSSAIVLRTALSDSRANSGPTYDNEAALMLVVPGVQTGGGPKSSVYVAFLDPLTFRSLTTLSYHAGPAVPGGASG